MNRSIENMMNEHRLIVKVLASLDAMGTRLGEGQSVPREDVAGFASFFRDFADRCHHGKEEDLLFAKMNECGFPREFGPVGVMLAEHTAGRTHVGALVQAGQGAGRLSAQESRELAAHIAEYVPLLSQHIQKEDNILYPMAQQAIPAAELARLDEDCARFDGKASGTVQRLQDLALELVGKYPATPEALTAKLGQLGCLGHGCGGH